MDTLDATTVLGKASPDYSLVFWALPFQNILGRLRIKFITIIIQIFEKQILL